jgi:hypothetical protein
MSKQTAVEWLDNELWALKLKLRGGEISLDFYFEQKIKLINQAKKMEKEQSQNYAIFAIRCDRTEMRILEFNDYIKLEENEEK